MRLIRIEETGTLSEQVAVDDFLREVIEATASHYQRTGFVPPWIGYVGLVDDFPVGVCGFKGQPINGRVEIASWLAVADGLWPVSQGAAAQARRGLQPCVSENLLFLHMFIVSMHLGSEE